MTVWDELVGQDHAIESFSAAVADSRAMTHAWLITGPPGSGRSVAARAFAASLQCEHTPGGCGECKSCLTVMNGTHPDVTFVATDHVVIDIDTVRELVTSAAHSPSQGKWRVIVIEDADRMVERTSNVLLKSLEEPAPRTVWLLCAPSPEDVIVTVRSRCRHVSLRIPDPHAVADLLVRRDGVDPELALVCARASQSHIGIARRLALYPDARERRRSLVELPSRIRGVGDAVFEAASLIESAAQDAKAVAEQRDAKERAELFRALGLEEDAKIPPQLRAQIRQLEEHQKKRSTRVQRDALDRAMTELLTVYRDVLVIQFGGEVLLINEEPRPLIESMAARSTREETLQRMDAIGVARERIDANVQPTLAVEAMLLSLRPAR